MSYDGGALSSRSVVPLEVSNPWYTPYTEFIMEKGPAIALSAASAYVTGGASAVLPAAAQSTAT